MILKQKVTIQQATSVKDSEGVVTQTWTNATTNVTAHIEPLGGERALREYGYAEITTHRMFTWASPVAGQRILDFAGKVYLVKYVADFSKHREVLLEWQG
ncbi:MAG: phage head completion protein [Thermincolia bacterium]